MKWFMDLKLRSKVFIAFLGLVILMAIMGSVGIFNLQKISKLDAELYENNTKPITFMSEVQVNLQKSRVITRNIMIENDMNKNREYKNLMLENDKQVDENLKEFKSSIQSEEVLNEYNNLRKSIDSYKPVRDKIIDLRLQNKTDEAINLMNGEGYVLVQNIDDSASRLIALKETHGKDKADSNLKSANTAIITMIGIIFLGIIAALTLGIIISGLISKPINRVLQILQEMSKGHLGERLNIETKDEIGQMAKVMDTFSDTLQDVIVGTMNKIAKGDVSMDLPAKDDKDEIAPALNKMIENVRRLVTDANILSEAAVEGKLDVRADASKHSGDFKKVVEGVNNTLDSVIKPLNVAAEYVDRISKGDIPDKIITEYHGDFNEIKNNLNNCIDVMNGLLNETNNLIKATQAGELSARGNSEKFAGGWGTLVDGINKLIDAFVDPINVTAEYVDRISKGDIPEKITDTYYGDFNSIKNNLNNCIDNVRALVEDANMLSKAAAEGKLNTRADAAKHSGDYRKIVEGVNELIEAMVKPIQEVTNVMNEISQGNLELSVSEVYKGEFGVLAKAVNSTEKGLKGIVGEIADVIGQISNGNLAIESVQEFNGNFRSISVSLNKIIDSLNNVLSEINCAAEQVFSGAGQVSDGSQALSRGATEQASSIEELTASITEIAAQTRENSINANEAKELALKVKENAETGNRHMSEMLKSMGEINESSANISKIIKVIDEIAFQTNILALNAAVEAARAGQHGKGFAVVAEEVRNLAARSANAAKETTDLIEGSIKKAERGTEIANNTAKALYEIVDGVSRAATIVTEIAEASEEQATGITQINVGVEQVSHVVQTNSATAEQSAAASEELSSQSELLKDMVSNFKLKNQGSSVITEFRNHNKNKNSAYEEAAVTINKGKIDLSNNDFGKY